MFLTALEIQGFKSFPDRTKVLIDKGITAVVGPNGSGKSNISDAIRWVLGETSAKQLRGGGKMENVIFGGTQQRGAMGYASVQLYIDNADRRVDVDSDEVIIGRKYYRSGDSEYSINGQNVRLRDVYELFLDTGIGRDGYSIIGQGRIAEIVGAKSGERREIFEEASGIAKYRYRKNEAERRLSSTEENLVRLRDILAELEERVVPLAKDADKAKAYLELAGKRKEQEITLWVDTVRRARDTVREQQRKIEIANADYQKMTAEMDAVDASTEDIRAEIQRMIMDSDRLNSEMRAITEQLSGADAQIAVLHNNIEHNAASIASYEAEIAQSSEGREDINAQVAEHKKTIAACEVSVAELSSKTAQLEASLGELQAKSAASGERRGVLAAMLNEMTARSTDLQVRAASASSAAESAKTRFISAESEREQSVKTLLELQLEKADTDAFLQAAVAEITKLENIKNGLAIKLDSRKKTLSAADDAEQSVLRAIESTTQRAAMLKDLERNMDGFQHSVKTVMKAAASHRLRGMIGPVSTILTVKSGYEIAVETALGFALQNVVVENESAAKAAMTFLREEKAGRATFLPLDTVKGSYFDKSKLPEGALCASSIVQYDARYENIVSSLLGRIVIVDNINEASRVARALDYRNRVVTLDGQVINAGGSFTGGSVSQSAGLFSRKQEIEDLHEKLKNLEKKRIDSETATDKAKAEVDALTAELTATQSEIINAGGDKIRGEVETQRINMALSQAQAAQVLLLAECESLTARIAENELICVNVTAENEALSTQSAQLESEMAAISGKDDTFLTTRTRWSDELSEAKLRRLASEKDIESHTAAIVTLEGRSGDANERAKQLATSIEALREQNTLYDSQIVEISQNVAGSKSEIALREVKIEQTANARMEKEGSITQQNAKVRQLTTERENLSREVARLTEQKETRDAEYEQTVAKLWEEYELSLSDAEQLCVPFETSTELRRSVAELRAKIKALGNVNVGAIDEYAQVSARYEFMRTQVGDVEHAKLELEKLIAGISEQMRTLFTESFAQINRNFSRIFQELFGGGSARLSLDDEMDVLDSGITIEVAPPGKIIKDLSSLSGGEQALVAISVYFAILAVNPAPFCILDEIEAALDDVNVTRYANYLKRICDKSQFILITHRRGTMEAADVLYGVTMQEEGVSKLLRLDVNNVDASLIS